MGYIGFGFKVLGGLGGFHKGIIWGVLIPDSVNKFENQGFRV